MIAPALEKIAGQLDAIADQLEAGHDIDPQDLHHAARQLRAQAEMVREGLAE